MWSELPLARRAARLSPGSGNRAWDTCSNQQNWIEVMCPRDLCWNSVAKNEGAGVKTTHPPSVPTKAMVPNPQRVCSVARSCPTLYDPTACSPPVSSVHGISQARTQSGLPFPPPGDLPDRPRARSQVSCIGRWILYHQCHLGSPPNLQTIK